MNKLDRLLEIIMWSKKCGLCVLRIPNEEPNMYKYPNNMCYACWKWIE